MKKNLHLPGFIVLISLVLSACGSGPLFGPTPTLTPTFTPSATLTPVPTLTPTPSPAPTATPTSAVAAGQMAGRVFWSSSNDPISDFTITLEGTDKVEATTDADGKYSFQDLKPGKYSVSISWNLDKGGKPMPCQQFKIKLPSSVTGTALSLGATNDQGEHFFISVGLEVEIKADGGLSADFQAECS
jgi:hypothetical protein